MSNRYDEVECRPEFDQPTDEDYAAYEADMRRQDRLYGLLTRAFDRMERSGRYGDAHNLRSRWYEWFYREDTAR